MMSAMLIAGAFAVLAGLGAIALGIPVKEFSFGNTMILSGTIVVCTGLLLLGLSAVLGELRVIAHRLRLRVADETGSRTPDDRSSAAERREPLSLPDVADGPGEDSRRESGFLRARARQAELVPPLPEPEARPADREAPSRPRRNLFSEAASRRDRERAEKRDSLTSDLRSPSMSEPPALEPMQPPPFDDGWSTNKPDRDRGRGSEPPPLLRRPARAAPVFDQQDAEPLRGSDAPEVNLIKSGVVDGMAYSLYSDGSIEAQMPEGMMRFDSIAELRTHLDQRN